MTKTPEQIISNDVRTEEGFRTAVQDLNKLLKELSTVLSAIGDTVRQALSNTFTAGDPTANSRAEARAIGRRFQLASMAVELTVKWLRNAVVHFDNKFVSKEARPPGMKMKSGRNGSSSRASDKAA